MPGIGKGRFRRLVAQFGSPSAGLGARLPELESVRGISSALAIAIKTAAGKIHDAAADTVLADGTLARLGPVTREQAADQLRFVLNHGFEGNLDRLSRDAAASTPSSAGLTPSGWMPP